MASLEERFQRLLSIRAQILELVAEADTLLPQGGMLILSELQQGSAPSQSPAKPAPARINEPITTTPQPSQTSLAVTKPDEEDNRPHPYTPRAEGPLKGKSLAVAVQEVMRQSFSQVAGVNRQIMAILADQGFDGFAAHSLEDPMEQVRNILANHPNIERPTRKTYVWVEKPAKSEEGETQNPNPPLTQPFTEKSPAEPKAGIIPQRSEEQPTLPGAENEDLTTYLQLVSGPKGPETNENGDEEL